MTPGAFGAIAVYNSPMTMSRSWRDIATLAFRGFFGSGAGCRGACHRNRVACREGIHQTLFQVIFRVILPILLCCFEGLNRGTDVRVDFDAFCSGYLYVL